MVQLPFTPYRNQSLFSDHYLADILPKDNLWIQLIAEARPAMDKIAALYDAYLPSNKESQIEHDLIRPVLAALGHTFEIAPSLQMPGSPQTPDCVFYRDQAALNANKGKMLTDTLPKQGAYAIGEAEHWDCPLDVPTKGASAKLLTNGNPSFQIASYIQHSGLNWGILTNGRHWRLYHRATAHKLDRFYDVDVPALLATHDPAQFAWFFGFFRREAFSDAPVSGRGVGYILDASATYAQKVGESLKEQVYKALLYVAQGFLDHPANHLSPDDPDTRKEIYDNALILLYRLLFIFYAEARGLLPVGTNTGYYDEYSLFRIARSGAQAIEKGTLLLTGSAKLWHSLKELFAIINGGSTELGVATFNGGLFDPEKHPFLEEYVVGDARLRQAIDELARVNVPSMLTGTKKGDINREFVDYRDLSERHLGTIYEGLLEFRLMPREPDTQMKFTLAPGDADQWTVDIRNDKGERKVTGSYYTPDYIVKYIVEQTVLPVLDAAVADAPDYNAKVNAVLAVKALDPAMGSGHFLVEATEQIARYLLNLEPPESDPSKVRDLAYWKRRVVQSCIFGVDLNPLAVELAKLSLWLATVANDQPLSFLDHHLRVGNALIGARVADLDMLNNPAFQSQLRQALVQVGRIEASAAADATAVKEQERIYAAMRAALTERYGIVADAYVARYFGADYPAGQWGPFRDWLIGRNTDPQPQYDQWRASIEEMAQNRHFFHWELEFPEAFFAADGRAKDAGAGFDAVIGNPPWIRQEGLTADKPALKARFAVFNGIADIYTYFVELGNVLLRHAGHFGFIIPNKFVRANYGVALRMFLAQQTSIERVVDFNDLPIFPGAVTYPMIVLTTKPPGSDATVRYSSLHSSSAADLARAIDEHARDLSATALSGERWSLSGAASRMVMEKLIACSRPLGALDGINIFYGIKTGFNDAFYLDQTARDYLIAKDPKSAEIIKPLLVGADVKRYQIDDERRYMIVTKIGVEIERYPAIFAHLKQFQTQLEKRSDKGKHWWELRACDYYAEFEKPKIMWPIISDRSNFGYHSGLAYSDDKTFFFPTDDTYLLAVLNSRALFAFFTTRLTMLQNGFYEFRAQTVTQAPIRYIAFSTPSDKRTALVREGIGLSDAGDADAVLAFVAARLASHPEQSDVVRDLLAHLAQRMIDLHKERRAAHEHFRDWLRENQGVPVATFKPKSAFDAFHVGTYADFAAWMKKNRREISYHDDAKYREAFTHASADVRRIEARIASTDRLIDRIVYALYGLTKGEIAIVEESMS